MADIITRDYVSNVTRYNGDEVTSHALYKRGLRFEYRYDHFISRYNLSDIRYCMSFAVQKTYLKDQKN